MVDRKALRKKIRKKIIGWSLILSFFLSCSVITASATQTDAGVSEPDLIGLSFYHASTSLTSYVNDVVGPNTNDLHQNHKVESTQTPGNAGALIGYGDEKNGFHSYLTSNLSLGASTSSYPSWLGIIDGSSANDAYVYARYGRVLTDAGLDQTAYQFHGIGIRQIFGSLMMMIYVGSESIPVLFSWALKLLKGLNPFALLSQSLVLQNWNVYPEPEGLLQQTGMNLVSFVSSVYQQLVNLSWTGIVPLFFAVFLFEILLFQRKNQGAKWMQLFKRVLFMVVGIPACALLYTAALKSLSDFVSTKTAGSQMIAATFMDFEPWAKEAALAPDIAGENVLIESMPSEENEDVIREGFLNHQGGAASQRMLYQLRHSVFYLNKALHPAFTHLGDLVGSKTEQMISGGIWNQEMSGLGYGNTVAGGSDTHASAQLLSQLQRYTLGSFYRATDYETTCAGWMTKNYNHELGHTSAVSIALSNQRTIYAMYHQTDSPNDWLDRYPEANAKIFAGQADTDAISWGDKPWNIFAYGTLSADGDTRNERTANASLIFHGRTPGLSKLSLYNYLSTSFDKNSIVTYSPKTSPSEYTKGQHYSVNLIGSGVLRYAYGVNLLIVLGVVTCIGWTYSIGTTIKNLKTGIQLIMAVPGASLGVAKSIAQVCVYTVMMVAELIGASFFYVFLSEMFVVIGMAVENAVSFLSFGSISIGGLFASIHGVDAQFSVSVSLVLQSFLVLFLGYGLNRYKRAYAYAWNQVRGWGYRMLSTRKMQPIVDKRICKDPYPYFMDDLRHSVFTWIQKKENDFYDYDKDKEVEYVKSSR